MSLLNEIPQPSQNSPEKKASRIKYINVALANEIIRCWHEGWGLIWDDPNPQAVLDALGEDAGELFAINEETLLFLSNALGGRRQSELDSILAKVATKPATTTDENGNVTII